jgi:hypothetical protein
MKISPELFSIDRLNPYTKRCMLGGAGMSIAGKACKMFNTPLAARRAMHKIIKEFNEKEVSIKDATVYNALFAAKHQLISLRTSYNENQVGHIQTSQVLAAVDNALSLF